MPIVVQQKVLIADVLSNENVKYVYVENDKRSGGTSLAIFLRDSDQGIGLRMKKAHGDQIGCYWDDKEFKFNIDKMKEDIGGLEEFLKQNGTAVLAKGDFDSYSKERFLEISPRSYKYFEDKMTKLLRIYRP